VALAALKPRFDDVRMTAQRATRGQPSISGSVASRFAPSPTGRLHLGHALSAVTAHDLAKAVNGQFFVRIEDIDGGRSRPEFVAAIFEDLAWLGLDWAPEVLVQSAREDFYQQALGALIAQGLVYRCICSRAEIAASASAPQGDLPPVYPGTCRIAAVAGGDPRPSCWRLDMAKAVGKIGPLEWTAISPFVPSEVEAPVRHRCLDFARHERIVQSDPKPFGDVVIARKDALASYHLAVVVDDAAQGITDVVRGADLFAATHIHRLLQALLGLPTPRYHHHALVTGPGGKRLAKRTPGATLADLRVSGVDGRRLADDLRCGRLPLGFALAND
jgi:glutamyl-Q tRNA(Asp) synthetase